MSDSLRPHDYSTTGSSIHGIFQVRILECVAISYSKLATWAQVYFWALYSVPLVYVSVPTHGIMEWITPGMNPIWSYIWLSNSLKEIKSMQEIVSKEIKIVNLKRNQPWKLIGRIDAKAEAQVFWSFDVNTWLIGKVPDTGKDWRQKEKSASEDEMAGWHHWCNGHELGQASGDGEGQEGLEWFSPWGLRVGHNWATEQLLISVC